MRNKVCFILGCGGSLLNLTEEEIEYVNNSECVLAFNKYMIFHEMVGIKPTHYLLGDTGVKADLMFNKTLRKCINFYEKPIQFILDKSYKNRFKHYKSDENRVIKSICGEKFSESKFSKIVDEAIYIERTDWLKGGDWADSLQDKIFHFRGSLSGAINICNILHPSYDIKLLGVDLNNHAYFFQKTIEAHPEKWGVFLNRLTPESKEHETIINFKGVAGIQDMFPFIMECLSQNGSHLYCCNPESYLVKQNIVPYSPITPPGFRPQKVLKRAARFLRRILK